MKIRYKGGRSRYEISLDRKAYYFTPENGKVLDIQDQRIINYIFSLPNGAEFEAVMEESNVDPTPIIDIKEEPIIIKKDKSKKGRK